MRSAENIERIAYELGQDAAAEGVRYIEVRFAPQLHAGDKLTVADAVRAVVAGLRRAQKEHNALPAVKKGEDLPFYFGVITCAMRSFNANMSPYYKSCSACCRNIPSLKCLARRRWNWRGWWSSCCGKKNCP